MSTQEHIGYCAWCGVLDHHVIDDMCPDCHTAVAKLAFEYSADKLKKARHRYGAAQLYFDETLRGDVEKLDKETINLIRKARISESVVDDFAASTMRLSEIGIHAWVAENRMGVRK